MEEGKRQKQVAGAIQSTMNDIFLKLGLNHLSLFQVADQETCFKKIQAQAWDIKKHLQEAMKHQLRRIPVLHFYLDDTLDYVFKMEEIFKKL
jgi:ribosome-binding factor A